MPFIVFVFFVIVVDWTIGIGYMSKRANGDWGIEGWNDVCTSAGESSIGCFDLCGILLGLHPQRLAGLSNCVCEIGITNDR